MAILWVNEKKLFACITIVLDVYNYDIFKIGLYLGLYPKQQLF